MICLHCGRYQAPDPETGYDGPDGLCPTCEAERDDCARDDAADAQRELALDDDDRDANDLF